MQRRSVWQASEENARGKRRRGEEKARNKQRVCIARACVSDPRLCRRHPQNCPTRACEEGGPARAYTHKALPAASAQWSHTGRTKTKEGNRGGRSRREGRAEGGEWTPNRSTRLQWRARPRKRSNEKYSAKTQSIKGVTRVPRPTAEATRSGCPERQAHARGLSPGQAARSAA